MARRRNATVNLDAEDNIASKVWKANPAGREQKELNRMFEKGLIGVTDTPAKVRARIPMFMAFPTKTFALHFRTTKARYGLNAAATSSSVIPELGGLEEEPTESTLLSPDKFLDTQLEARNYPFMSWTYTDHVEQKDFVCVAVPTATGSRDIKFAISEDGLQLFVEYVWPTAFLDPAELFFSVDDDDGAIPMSHPMVYSYRKRLDELDLGEKSRPGASLVVSLPFRVQRELGTFVKRALKCGDTRVIMLQFTGYQNKRVISDADTSIKF